MANKVFIGKDGFIHCIYEGDQSYEIVKETSEQIFVLCKQLRLAKKPVLVLGDYSLAGHSDSGSRKAAHEEMSKRTGKEYDKVALFGKSVFHTVAANLIIKATNKGVKIKVFRTREEAEG
ncbi:MAG: hypothetical protein ACYDCN_11375 [Bacteroidia bacterium]